MRFVCYRLAQCGDRRDWATLRDILAVASLRDQPSYRRLSGEVHRVRKPGRPEPIHRQIHSHPRERFVSASDSAFVLPTAGLNAVVLCSDSRRFLRFLRLSVGYSAKLGQTKTHPEKTKALRRWERSVNAPAPTPNPQLLTRLILGLTGLEDDGREAKPGRLGETRR